MRFRVVVLILIQLVAVALTAQQAERRLSTAESTAQSGPRITGGGGNTPTNLDLMSLFAAALESYSASGGQAITLDYKLPGLGTRLLGKAQLVLRQPKLSDALLKQLGSDTTKITELESDLGYGDDIAVTLSIAPAHAKAEEKVRNAFEIAAAPCLPRGSTSDRAAAIAPDPWIGLPSTGTRR